MNGRPGVSLEIERLVLHDPGMSGARAERLRGLVEAELVRLLPGVAVGGSAESVQVVVPAAGGGSHPDDDRLATRLARAIVAAIEEGRAHAR
jgi:hypothetical protein